MTDKQRAFLEKHISEELINSDKFGSFSFVRDCIGFIIATNSKNDMLFDIRTRIEVPSEKITELKQHINANRKQYSGPNDEAYYFNRAFYITGSERAYFVFEQAWCKGMSDSISRNYITVDENAKQITYNTQYEELFRMGINSLSLFFEYLKRNKFGEWLKARN